MNTVWQDVSRPVIESQRNCNERLRRRKMPARRSTRRMKSTRNGEPRKTITLADVARACGLSISSVSLVLNDKPLADLLSEATRQSIRSAAARLGYTPNRNAQALRSRRSSTIGVMVFDLADPFCTLILKGIQAALEPTGMLPIIMDATHQGKHFERYLDLMMERRVEGLIVVANWLFADKNITPHLESLGIPIVVVGRDLNSHVVSCILVDNEAGGFLAMRHLHQAGHRRIAIVRGPRGLADSRRRWQGIERFAATAQFTLPTDLVVEMPDAGDPLSGFEGGFHAIEALLAEDKTFTAVLAFDDLTALGAIRALHARGLRVPQHVSVIGFDDIPTASLTSPSLSTIRQDMSGMGTLAAVHVIAMIKSAGASGGPTPSTRLTMPLVVARDSTAPLKPRSKRSAP